jgi:putative ATP-dependent endonuclease of OLD family
MGTRSLASLLVFRAYTSWRYKKATEGGDSVHSVLALEEPESHLHPQAQRALFGHIKQVTGQRIVSTHSPYFAGQAPLEDLRLFSKSKGETMVTKLDTSVLKADDIRKLQDTVVDTRGDILFSRGVLLFEGQTEEQALPVYASRYWNASIHELGFCFVRVNGNDYFPYIWLLKALRIPWYVFADGEAAPLATLEAALKKAGEPASANCANVVVLPSGNGFEQQLLAEGYLPEIEAAIDQVESKEKFLDDYMAHHHGGKKKKGIIRDYQSAGARERAAEDFLLENKTRMAKPVAVAISSLSDETRRFPAMIEQALAFVGQDNGLKKAEDSK